MRFSKYQKLIPDTPCQLCMGNLLLAMLSSQVPPLILLSVNFALFGIPLTTVPCENR